MSVSTPLEVQPSTSGPGVPGAPPAAASTQLEGAGLRVWVITASATFAESCPPLLICSSFAELLLGSEFLVKCLTAADLPQSCHSSQQVSWHGSWLDQIELVKQPVLELWLGACGPHASVVSPHGAQQLQCCTAVGQGASRSTMHIQHNAHAQPFEPACSFTSSAVHAGHSRRMCLTRLSFVQAEQGLT